MLVLGLSNGAYAGAAIVADGVTVAAASEERFIGVKNASGIPLSSMGYVLSEASALLTDVDAIAYGWSKGFDAARHLDLYLQRYSEFDGDLVGAEIFRRRIDREIHNDAPVRDELFTFLESQRVADRLIAVDHHEAHGRGSFHASGFDSALVVTADGRGDFQSLTVSHALQDGYVVLQQETSADSLGYFYGRLTSALGYRPNDQEGKLTGLAAAGDPSLARDLMQSMIILTGDGRVRAKLGESYEPWYEVAESSRFVAEIARRSPADVAAAAQEHLEHILVSLIDRWQSATGERMLCLGGGIFGNVRLIGALRKQLDLDDLYVMPAMGDVGLPLQAALVASHDRGVSCAPVQDARLGPSASSSMDELTQLALSSGLEIIEPLDIYSAIASNLLGGCIVGTFRGRMEYGPRALGNRSILVSTNDRAMSEMLNEKLARNDFMPFAPIIAADHAGDCLVDWDPKYSTTRFMVETFQCTDEFAASSPGAVHIDQTCRPQVVSSSDDPFLHELLIVWQRMSGQKALINTSFNSHGSPIVNRAKDLIEYVENGTVDLLLVEDRYLIRRAPHDCCE